VSSYGCGHEINWAEALLFQVTMEIKHLTPYCCTGLSFSYIGSRLRHPWNRSSFICCSCYCSRCMPRWLWAALTRPIPKFGQARCLRPQPLLCKITQPKILRSTAQTIPLARPRVPRDA